MPFILYYVHVDPTYLHGFHTVIIISYDIRGIIEVNCRGIILQLQVGHGIIILNFEGVQGNFSLFSAVPLHKVSECYFWIHYIFIHKCPLYYTMYMLIQHISMVSIHACPLRNHFSVWWYSSYEKESGLSVVAYNKAKFQFYIIKIS